MYFVHRLKIIRQIYVCMLPNVSDQSVKQFNPQVKIICNKFIEFMFVTDNLKMILVFSKDDDASEKFCAFWSRLLNGSLTKLIQNENHALARAAACDALGAIGETILEKLEVQV